VVVVCDAIVVDAIAEVRAVMWSWDVLGFCVGCGLLWNVVIEISEILCIGIRDVYFFEAFRILSDFTYSLIMDFPILCFIMCSAGLIFDSRYIFSSDIVYLVPSSSFPCFPPKVVCSYCIE